MVDANLLAVRAAALSGEIVNVACGEEVTLVDLGHTIDAVIGRPSRIVHEPERLGDVRESQANIEAARNLLGYEPRIAFPEGIRRTIDWYRSLTPQPE